MGCTKDKPKPASSIKSFDSINYYIRFNDEDKLSDSEKILKIDKAFKLISKLDNTNEKREYLFNVALIYYNMREWSKFDLSSSILLKNSLTSKDSSSLVKAYRYRAGYLKKNQVFDSSFYYYLKAENIYKKKDDKFNYANILFNKGIVQYSVNDYLGADLSLTTAYYIFNDYNDKRKTYETVAEIAVVAAELEDFDKAINFNNIALKILEESEFDDKFLQTAICLNNLGYDYQQKKDFKNAIKNYKSALKIGDIRNQDPELFSTLLDNYAYSKLKSYDFNNLPKMFFESFKIRDSIDNSISKILSYNHISEYYLAINDTAKAKAFSMNALKTANESKKTIDLITALKQASNVDKKNSSKYSSEYIRLNDSLQNVERNSKDRFARLQLETDEIIQQKDILEEKNRNILNYFLGAIIIGGFLFFIRIQRSRSRELVLKQSQQQANEEIYRLIISHQNQLEEGRDLEKKRLSKELHDGVLGRLFGLRLNLDGLNNSDDQSAKQQRLDYLNELQLIEQDLRDISHELNRENLVLINNFVAIINNLLEQQAKINPAKIKTIIADDIDWEIVSNTSKINLYRILQEALQNINKHAEAKTILVHFRKDKKGNLLFNIEDDGKGYDLNGKKSKGIGMKNIVSRTQQCQGIIDIKSEIGKGSKIIITFPLESKTIKV